MEWAFPSPSLFIYSQSLGFAPTGNLYALIISSLEVEFCHGCIMLWIFEDDYDDDDWCFMPTFVHMIG